MSEIKRGRGYVYAIQYHIVWCVKYRHKILVEEIDARLKEILVQIASDNNFTISEIESDSDQIHLLVDCTPQHSIPSMIKALKVCLRDFCLKSFQRLKRNCGEAIFGILLILLQP